MFEIVEQEFEVFLEAFHEGKLDGKIFNLFDEDDYLEYFSRASIEKAQWELVLKIREFLNPDLFRVTADWCIHIIDKKLDSR